ncbi:MAG: hypothetical protein C0602_03495 [Denitrovibrio sp.]|nr:MAG: hypothetical protein C0602_03495 [Denitrovibrio sp.]
MKRVINISAVNIKFVKSSMHKPHNYVKLLKYVSQNHFIGKIRKHSIGMLGELNTITNANGVCISGMIYRFTDIDDTCPWFNTKTNQLILDDKGEPIPLVDKNNKPNTETTRFVFFSNGHRFLFDNKIIAPRSLQKLLDSIFSINEVRKMFGNIEVEVETSQDKVKEIVKIKNKRSLFLEFTVPNPDDLSAEKAKVAKRIEMLNLRKYNELYVSDDSIKLDDEAKAKIDIASSNGKIIVKTLGKDGKIHTMSTDEYPLDEKTYYDGKKTSNYFNAFMSKSEEIWKILKKRG